MRFKSGLKCVNWFMLTESFNVKVTKCFICYLKKPLFGSLKSFLKLSVFSLCSFFHVLFLLFLFPLFFCSRLSLFSSCFYFLFFFLFLFFVFLFLFLFSLLFSFIFLSVFFLISLFSFSFLCLLLSLSFFLFFFLYPFSSGFFFYLIFFFVSF